MNRRAGEGFRADIQGLRALAVSLVLIYHLWPQWLPGGYVGVDVFFVISGYLITSHLARELERTGTVRVGQFWARRIRRLLPASLLVLAVLLPATAIWMPASERTRTYTDIAASATYIVNWLFARDAVDYLAQDDAPSLVQHYWSLAVEEQLYVIWPLLIVTVIMITALVARRNARDWATRRNALLAVLGVAFISSLGLSAALTSQSPGEAYFNTFVRVFEFAAGALLAVAAAGRWSAQPRSRQALRVVGGVGPWLGVAFILVAAFAYDDRSPFPGLLALLPVTGVILVIAGGYGSNGPLTVGAVADRRPVQSVGMWSYSIYLWHWPLIVLAPYIVARQIGELDKVAIIVLAVMLGALTSRFVEDPFRARPWGRRPWREFTFAVAIPTIIVLISMTHVAEISTGVSEATTRATSAAQTSCHGVLAILDDQGCPDAFTVDEPIDTAFAGQDLDPAWCLTQPNEEWRSCAYGDESAPSGTIAVVGDSHAASMIPAFEAYFGAEGWRILSFTRFGCPALATDPDQVSGEASLREACAAWSARVQDELRTRSDIDIVVFNSFSRAYFADETGRYRDEATAQVRAVWDSIEATGKEVVLLRDIPDTGGKDIPMCLSTISVPALAPCSMARSIAVIDDSITSASTDAVPLVDLSDLFCTSETCFSYIGGVVVYADTNHVSGTYARSIAPILGPAVLEAAR